MGIADIVLKNANETAKKAKKEQTKKTDSYKKTTNNYQTQQKSEKTTQKKQQPTVQLTGNKFLDNAVTKANLRRSYSEDEVKQIAKNEWNKAMPSWEEHRIKQQKKQQEKKERRKNRLSGGWSKGFDLADIPNIGVNTVKDIYQNARSTFESAAHDTAATGALGIANLQELFGDKKSANKLRDIATGQDEEYNKKIDKKLKYRANPDYLGADKYSILNETADNLVQGGSYMALQAALQSIGVPWEAFTAASSYGGKMGEARANGASMNEARVAAANKAALDVLTEKLFGGFKLPRTGGKTVESIAGKYIDNLSSPVARQILGHGINAAGEGLEENIAGFFDALVSGGAYGGDESKSRIQNMLDSASKYTREQALRDFLGGAALSTFSNALNPQTYQSIRENRNPITGLTVEEQNAINQRNLQQQIDKEERNFLENQIKEITDKVNTQQMTRQEGQEAIQQILSSRVQDRLNQIYQPTQTPIINRSRQLAQQAVQQINEQVQNRQITPQEGIKQVEDIQNYLRAQETQTEQQQTPAVEQENAPTINETTQGNINTQEQQNVAQNANNEVIQDVAENAKRYEDLSKSNKVEYFRKDNGDVRVYFIDSNNNLINEIDITNQNDAVRELGENLGNRIFNTANDNNQNIELGNDINNLGNETDYFMTHRPTETSITADNLTNQDVESPMPKDMYEHPEYYFDMREDYTKESMNVLRKIKNNPNAEITIYRATKGDKINKGDWVTLSKKYAEMHNNSQLDGKGNIIEMKVKPTDIQFAGDEINEWGYFPRKNNNITATKNENVETQTKPKGKAMSLQEISDKLGVKNNNVEKTTQQEYNKVTKEEGVENEFRRLQEESRNISNEEQQAYRNGSKEIDENLRGRLSRVLGQRVESSRSSNSDDARVLKDNKSGNTFEIYDKVDGQTFRDVFEIARTYTKNGELVDLHPVETNEDATGYNDTDNYVTKDGLSGYAITKDGDLISVFNANDKRGWLRAIKPDIEAKAKTLDCYMSENQPLSEMYEKIFGFKTASVMDYNMEYDHDDIAKNHNMPQVAFMVKTDQDIETKHFNKDQYNEALEYRNSLVDNQGTSDSSFSNETTNIPETKNEQSIKIELTGVPKNQIKTENTGISIGNKPVQIEVPINSSQNKLGQYVPKDGFTKKELKNGKIGDSKFYKNVTERADFISDEVRKQAQNDDYIKHHRKITNDESMQMAFDDLNTRGTEAIADFFNNDKELTSKDTAMGWLLIEQSQANGDYNFSNQVLRKMRSSATKTGQAMQMYNYYARLTPEGMYRWCGDQLLRAEEIFEKNKTKKWIEANKNRWQLNSEEVEFIKNQMEKVQKLNKMNDSDTTTIDIKGKSKKVTVDRAKQVEIAKIQAMIEDKIPHQKGQSLNAWMRISMLGNLKTIGTRNPLGNITLRPVNDAGDFVASLVDYAISKKTGVRTKGNLNIKAQAKGFKKGSSEAVQDFRLGIDTKNQKGNRFEIGQGKSFNEKHIGAAKVLNPLSKIGNKADTGVSFFLDLGDRPFYEATYAQSLENQMKLNGIEKAEDAPEWMKKIAEQEALERTYQDDNNYTTAVVDIRKAMNKFNVKGYGLGDVIIPFAKTPANLTKAIVDYSPAGFVSALTKGNELRTAINNEQFTPEMQHRFVNQLGKATAGTILYVIGAALANSGLITGGDDEDKDVADFMRNTLGIQPYSIKIGNKSFTYDWAQPVASAFAIPADIKKGIQDAKNQEVDLQYIIHKSFSTAGNILLEQSFLQGVKEVLGGYGDPLDNLMSEIEGLPARAVPTLFQQIVTYLDPTKRMSYGNKGIQNVISQAMAKTPFAKDLPVYRNSMGKEVKMYGGKNSFFNVFINPSNYSEGNATKSAEEIYAIYQATNDKTILPRTIENDLKNEDGTKLTNQQKSDFLKISGDFIDENVEKLTESNEYKNMSNEDKAATIKYIVDYAYNKARKEITGHKLSSEHQKTENAEKSGYPMADYFISKKVNKVETSKSTTSRNRYKELQQKGIDGRTFDDFVSFVKRTKGDSRRGGLSKKQKVINYIEGLNLSRQAKDALYEDYKNNQKTFTTYN